MYGKGYTWGRLDKPEEAMKVYDELIARFSESSVPAIQEQVAQALRNKGLSWGELDNHDEESKVYDELLTRFGDWTSSAIHNQVAKEFRNKRTILG